jgi:hypothetical protein
MENSHDYFIKVWFQLSKWFQTRRFLWEFPIGSYVKLSSAVGAIFALPPRWPQQCSCVVIESSFDPGERLQAHGSLWDFISVVVHCSICEIRVIIYLYSIWRLKSWVILYPVFQLAFIVHFFSLLLFLFFSYHVTSKSRTYWTKGSS